MYNQQLKILVCVADCGSFAKAAEKLFVSPTAIMKQINALEEHLALKLLERSPRGVSLTKAGQSIYKDALRLFEFSKEATARAHQIAGTVKTTFRVGTSMLNPCKVFMELWHKMSDEFPEYTIQIVPFEDDRSKILSEVEFLGKNLIFLLEHATQNYGKNAVIFIKLANTACAVLFLKNTLWQNKNCLKLNSLTGNVSCWEQKVMPLQ